MTRHRSLRRIACVVFVLVSLSLVGCGASPEGAVDEGAWPMQVDLPGVLGYGVLSVRPGELDRLFAEAAGIDIDGLADGGKLLMIQLDETTHGGTQSFAVPIASRDLVIASIDSAEGSIERLDGQRLQVTLEADSGLGQLVSIARMASAQQSGGLAAMTAMLSLSAPVVFTMNVEVTGEHLIMAPAFEGVAVTRAMVDRLSNLSRSSGPDDVVFVIDVERNMRAYHAQIQEVRSKLRMALSAAPAAGFGAMLMQGLGERGDADDNPLSWIPSISADVLDALIKMIEPIEVTAMRFEATRGTKSLADFSADGDEGLDDLVLSPLHGTMLVPDEGTLLGATRPAPRVPGAVWTVGADSDDWSDAASAWCRPLAVSKHGEGTAADGAVDELRELLAGWSGTAAVIDEEQPYALFTTDPAKGFDVPGLVRWFEPIAQRIGQDEKPTLTPAGEGFWYFVSADGSVAATVGTIGNDVLWLTGGDGDGPSMDAVDAILRAPSADDGPFQRFTETLDGSEMSLEFSREPGVLTFDAIWTP